MISQLKEFLVIQSRSDNGVLRVFLLTLYQSRTVLLSLKLRDGLLWLILRARQTSGSRAWKKRTISRLLSYQTLSSFRLLKTPSEWECPSFWKILKRSLTHLLSHSLLRTWWRMVGSFLSSSEIPWSPTAWISNSSLQLSSQILTICLKSVSRSASSTSLSHQTAWKISFLLMSLNMNNPSSNKWKISSSYSSVTSKDSWRTSKIRFSSSCPRLEKIF